MFRKKSVVSQDVANNFDKAYNSALRFIEYAPQMEKPLFMKLIKKGYTIAVVKDVINHLKEVNLINDQTICKNYVDMLINDKCYGYNVILNKLIEKGIDKNEAKSLVESGFENSINEIDVMKKYIKKNLETFDKLYNNKKSEKIIFRLQTKGYKNNNIEKLINNFDVILDELKNS